MNGDDGFSKNTVSERETEKKMDRILFKKAGSYTSLFTLSLSNNDANRSIGAFAFQCVSMRG